MDAKEYQKFLIDHVLGVKKWLDDDKKNVEWSKQRLADARKNMKVNQKRLRDAIARVVEDDPGLDIMAILDEQGVEFPVVNQETGVYSNDPNNDHRDWE